MKHAKIEIKTVHLSEIKPHPRNPRVHPQPGTSEYETLRKSLEHDYFDPLILNENNGMWVSGHLRAKILMADGYEKADVVVKQYTEQEHIARMIAANKQIGGWFFEGLSGLMEELKEKDVDLSWTGYTPLELDAILEVDTGTPLIDLGDGTIQEKESMCDATCFFPAEHAVEIRKKLKELMNSCGGVVR